MARATDFKLSTSVELRSIVLLEFLGTELATHW